MAAVIEHPDNMFNDSFYIILYKNKLHLISLLERGRPPKSSYMDAPLEPSGSSSISGDFDLNPDSPPKAKRKSRPPRRHKPDQDLSDTFTTNEEMAAANHSLPTDAMGNVTLSSLDPSGLPTVENIHKYFSTRGRGEKIEFIFLYQFLLHHFTYF